MLKDWIGLDPERQELSLERMCAEGGSSAGDGRLFEDMG